MQKAGEIKIRDTLSQIPGTVSLTTNAWSSRDYRGYLSVNSGMMERGENDERD